MGVAYSSLGRTKVLHATSLVLIGTKAKLSCEGNLPVKGTECLSCLGRNF